MRSIRLYGADGMRRVGSFSGDALEEWDQILTRAIRGQNVSLVDDETETSIESNPIEAVSGIGYAVLV